ncbi:MAG: hypothetical protein JWQ11_1171 [Rhizobacter sp.]|nr:hypothetical protein [Rhizobacter sp.]
MRSMGDLQAKLNALDDRVFGQPEAAGNGVPQSLVFGLAGTGILLAVLFLFIGPASSAIVPGSLAVGLLVSTIITRPGRTKAQRPPR